MIKTNTWMNRLLSRFEKHKTGCVPNTEDPRDHPYRGPTAGDEGWQRPIHCITKQFYQGSAPSCVGAAVRGLLHIEEAANPGIRRESDPSVSWLYWFARYFDNNITIPLDGTSIRSCLNGLRKMGCCATKFRPYSTKPKKLNASPTQKQIYYASSRKNIGYEWIGGVNRINDIKAALDDCHPVIFRTGVTKEMKAYKKGTILMSPDTYDIIGYHAMVIVDYDGDNLLAWNSWHGKEFIWLHKDYLTWEHSGDFALLKGVK